MGTSPSTLADVHVVIAGASYAGVAAARDAHAAGFRVTVLDPRDKFFHVIGGPRTCVEPGFEQDLWVDLDRALPPSPRLTRIRGRAERVDFEKKLLTYSVVADFARDAPAAAPLCYDFLIIATGVSSWHRRAADSECSLLGMAADARLRAAVGAARSVCVIGGGAVGVEVAAEIKTDHPSTRVCLLHSGDALMSSEATGKLPPAFSAQLLRSLRAKGVEVHLGERAAGPRDDAAATAAGLTVVRPGVYAGAARLATASGRVSVEADLQLWMIGGGAPNTAFLSGSGGSAARVLSRQGFVRVRPTWQVATASSPDGTSTAPPTSYTAAVASPLDAVFALGDVSTGSGDGKFSHVCAAQAKEVVHNIRVMALHAIAVERARTAGAGAAPMPPPQLLRQHAPPRPMAWVTCGRRGGAAVFMGLVHGDAAVYAVKARDAFAMKENWSLGYYVSETRAANGAALKAAEAAAALRGASGAVYDDAVEKGGAAASPGGRSGGGGGSGAAGHQRPTHTGRRY